MQLSTSQLQTRHKALIEALKRGEEVELTYHGQVVGVVLPVKKAIDHKAQKNAFNAFFGMHSDLDSESVEDDLRTIRKGRRNR